MARPYELVTLAHAGLRGEVVDRLGPSDRARLAALDDARRARFLAGRSAVLAAVARLVGVPARAFTVDACCPECGGPHGRPEVVGGGARVHVGIAHAAGRTFAVASRSRIGLDAEPLGTPSERLEAIRHVTGHRGGDPLERWTATEAILKADGRGLRVDPRAVLVGRRCGRVSDRDTRYRLHRDRDLAGCVVTIAWTDQRDLGCGSGGSSVSSSHASNSASSGSSANPAACERKSEVDTAP